MKRNEMIDYLMLRAKECNYKENLLGELHPRLKALQDEELDKLIRVTELIFRSWCEKKDEGAAS